jgi:hypothetical protein
MNTTTSHCNCCDNCNVLTPGISLQPATSIPQCLCALKNNLCFFLEDKLCDAAIFPVQATTFFGVHLVCLASLLVDSISFGGGRHTLLYSYAQLQLLPPFDDNVKLLKC